MIAKDAIIQRGDLLDQWIWPEFSDGQPLMPGWDVTGETTQEEKNAFVTRAFEEYPEIVRCCEWQQHEGHNGAVNTCLQTWERHAFYFAESVEQALAQKGVSDADKIT